MATTDRRVAVITGGASGIGLATAKLLASDGWALTLADVDRRSLDGALGTLPEETPVIKAVVDVRYLDDVEGLAAQTYDTFGRVDFLFNNAGVAASGPIVSTTDEEWRWLNDVNLRGPINGVQAFLPRMIASQRGGHIVFTASFAGLTPVRGLGAYSVGKYAVVGLAEVLHRELRDQDLHVSVLCPMRVDTNIVGTSDHQRPRPAGRTAPAVSKSDFGEEAFAGAVLPASEVGQLVIDAIGTDRLYIFTHPETRELVARRFHHIDAAFEDSSNRSSPPVTA